MRFRQAMKSIFITVVLLGTFLPSSSAKQSELSSGHRLLIYYGIPQGVNQTWNSDKAANEFSQFDHIVLGSGLEEDKHSHHKTTLEVMQNTKKKNPTVSFYGYVDLGVDTSDLSIATMQDKINKWKEMGALGIFLDDAGYDYGVTRHRFNEIVEYVHDQDMSAFINAWKPDEVMGNKQDETYNPDMTPTAMDHRDIYLLEGMLDPVDITSPDSPSSFSGNFKKKMDSLLAYRKELQVRLMSVSTIRYEELSDSAVRKFFRMNEVTAGVFSLDAYGISPSHYSSEKATSNLVRLFPYLPNYKDYYSLDVTYIAKYNNQDFARNGFRLHSLKGSHYYNYPTD